MLVYRLLLRLKIRTPADSVIRKPLYKYSISSLIEIFDVKFQSRRGLVRKRLMLKRSMRST